MSISQQIEAACKTDTPATRERLRLVKKAAVDLGIRMSRADSGMAGWPMVLEGLTALTAHLDDGAPTLEDDVVDSGPAVEGFIPMADPSPSLL